MEENVNPSINQSVNQSVSQSVSKSINQSINQSISQSIAHFTVNSFGLHYIVVARECESISGKNCTIARNCLTPTFKYIVMQMRKVNCEKGYQSVNQ